MTDVEDLRALLSDRADAVDGGPTVTRQQSVRHRAGLVRRRRRAVAVGGLAALVVAAGVTTALTTADPDRRGSEPGPADRVVGVPAPDTMKALGFTYAFDHGVDGADGVARVHLPASDEPRLVSWATSGDDQAVTVGEAGGGAPLSYRTADFGDYLYLPAGGATDVRVKAEQGQAGVAVYTLGEARPAGVTAGGVTFPRTIVGGRLIDAVVGEPGQNPVEVPAEATGPGVQYRAFCVDGPKKAALIEQFLARSGSFGSGGGCGGPLPVTGDALQTNSFNSRRGEDVGVRLLITQGFGGPRVQDPDMRIGIAVYGLDRPGTGAGSDTPPTVEASGHAWRRVATYRSTSGRISASAPGGDRPVLALVASGTSPRTGTVTSTFGDESPVSQTGGGTSTYHVDAGTAGLVTVDATGRRAGDVVRLAYYVEDD